MIDPHSQTWAAVKAWAEARIETARNALEQPGLDIDQTNHQRGIIEAMRQLLDLTKPAPDIRSGGSY